MQKSNKIYTLCIAYIIRDIWRNDAKYWADSLKVKKYDFIINNAV